MKTQKRNIEKELNKLKITDKTIENTLIASAVHPEWMEALIYFKFQYPSYPFDIKRAEEGGLGEGVIKEMLVNYVPVARIILHPDNSIEFKRLNTEPLIPAGRSILKKPVESRAKKKNNLELIRQLG